MDNQNNNGTQGTPLVAVKVKKNTFMAALAYVGPLVIISYIANKDDLFVRFHIKQGLVLFAIEVIVWILGMLFFMLIPILYLINIAIFILAIVGIVGASKGKEMPLPLVGKYATHFDNI